MFSCYFKLTDLNPSRCGAEHSNLYFVGDLGEDCDTVCENNELLCTGKVATDNKLDLFTELGITCTPNTRPYQYE